VFINNFYNVFNVNLLVVSAHPSTALFWFFVTERAVSIEVDVNFVGLVVGFQSFSQVMQDCPLISFTFKLDTMTNLFIFVFPVVEEILTRLR
jgi:hypothetical protein